MFTHYLHLAWRSLRASGPLTVLMVLAIALGIGACMTTLTVYHVLAGDPIPAKSARLFDVQLDAGTSTEWKPGGEPQYQLTRFDAEALLKAGKARRQVAMSGSRVSVIAETPGSQPLLSTARITTSDFFAMFEPPFLFGSAWDAAADEARAEVVVISKSLNERLFNGENSVGRQLIVRRKPMRIVGVLNEWRPVPHYFDLTIGPYSKPADLFTPFSTAMAQRWGTSGNMNCWGESGPAGPRDINAPCAWVQYWVELASAADAAAFKQYLMQYSEEQVRAGRFQRPPNVRLRNVNEHLVHHQVLPADVALQVWLAFGFLLVCLVNTVGLLLAKCLRRSSEIGVRRALGATRPAIFSQYLVEAGLIGVLGGLLGLVLAAAGLWLVRQSPAEYAALAQMDWSMLATTLALALVASLLAGLLPAWHATRIAPAQHLKTL